MLPFGMTRIFMVRIGIMQFNIRRVQVALTALVVMISACSTMPGAGPSPDKTYQLTVLHTNDHHGRFWQDRKWLPKVVMCCCFPVVILTLEYLSLTCRMRYLISKA